MAKNVAWDILKKFAGKVDGVTFNESELRADFKNKSRITLYGADNPDSLRGIGLWGVIFDEYSQQPSNIFSEIVRPALSDHKGYAIWIGTPKGKNEFYRLYETAKKEEDWLALLLRAEDTHLISEKELEDSRKVMTADEFEQEWNCSFEAAIKGAYYSEQMSQARMESRITNVPYEMAIPVHTWWDLGVGDSTAILFMQQVGKEWRMIDSYEASGEGLAHYAQVLRERNYVYGEHHAPHDIEVRELSSGRSRKELAQQLGINFRVAPNISIDDGINAVRMRFNQLWIDEGRNQRFLDAISQYKKDWNDKMGDFKDKPFHDWTSHFADALRYWAVTPEIYGGEAPTQY